MEPLKFPLEPTLTTATVPGWAGSGPLPAVILSVFAPKRTEPDPDKLAIDVPTSDGVLASVLLVPPEAGLAKVVDTPTEERFSNVVVTPEISRVPLATTSEELAIDPLVPSFNVPPLIVVDPV